MASSEFSNLAFSADEVETSNKSKGPDMTSSSETARFALHKAILRKNTEKVTKLLQDKSFDVNALDKGGNTSLHCAAITGNVKLVRELITEKNARVNTVNKKGETALHLAAQYGKEMVTATLLENKSKKDAQDKEQLTPILTAAKHGCQQVVDVLLQANVQTDMKDSNGKTVLHLATENNHVGVLQVLLKYEEGEQNEHYTDIIKLLNIEDNDGETPLLVAAQRGHQECINELLKNGADLYHTCGKSKHATRRGEEKKEKKTALHFAAEGGFTEVVNNLLRSGIGLPSKTDKSGRTALHSAVIHDMKRTAEILIQEGADVDALDKEYRTPLSYAAEKGLVKCAKVLVSNGAKLDMGETSKRKLTPVQFATANGHPEVVQLLAEESETEKILEKTDFRKKNCLDIAIDNDHKATVMAIIQTDQWQDVLRNHTDEFESPMRKLIRYMPDAAIEVFNRCTTVGEKSGKEFQVKFNYEFLDDTMFLGSWKKDEQFKKNKPYTTKLEIIRDNHPLMIMVTSGRKELLDHPLVTALLKKKWHSVGLLFHLINFLIFALYLAMLTGFILDVKAPFQFANISTDSEACSEENIALYKIPKFAAVAKYFVIILAVLELFKEICELVLVFSCQIWGYFMVKENILEWIIYISSILFVWNNNDCEDTGYRPQWQWTCGTISVFLAWINMLLFTQKLEWLGIYVVMFYRIVKVFLKFFFVFSLLIVAFSISFHCLFQNQEPFATFWTSLVKTTAMMIGELDFGTIFHEEHVHYHVISYLFFYMFMLFMAIVIINLLIGLAVNNIQEFQERASLNKKEMQIKFALECEMRFSTTPMLLPCVPDRLKQRAVASTGETIELLKPNGFTFCNWLQKKIGESWGLTEENIKRALNTEKDGTGRELMRLNTKVTNLETILKEKMKTQESKLQLMMQSLKKLEDMADAK